MCRTSPSEFVIPYNKFLKAMDNKLAVGSRFRMKFESEESSERRFYAFLLLLLVGSTVLKFVSFIEYAEWTDCGNVVCTRSGSQVP